MSIENNGSPKSTKAITIVVAIIIIIIIALFVFLSPSSQTPANNTPTNTENGTPTGSASTTGGPTGGAFGEVKDAGEIYQIQIEKGALNPVSTTVAKGAVARIAFSAIDADYSISFASPIDMKVSLKKGQAALLPFDAQKNGAGEYAFTCKDSAGKTVSGKIVIK